MSLLRGMLLALLACLFIYPLERLLSLPFFVPSPGGIDSHAYLNSLGLAVLVGLIVAPLGALFAHALEVLKGRAVLALGFALWVLFLAPGYVLTTGWLVIFTSPVARNSAFGHAFLDVGGLIFLYCLKALPFAAFVARATFAQASSSLAEAAIVLGVIPWRRRLLALRLALPAIAASFTIAAIETIQEFGIPATLGVTTKFPIITYAIYQRLNTTPTDFAGAAALCWWLILTAGLLAVMQLSVQARHQAALTHGRARRNPPRDCAASETMLFGGSAALLWLLGVAAPMLALIDTALSGDISATDMLDSVPRSLGYGMLAASLALALGVIVLKLKAGRARWFPALLQVLLSANMAVPGLILGAGYVIAFNNDFLPLYGTVLLLIIAYTAAALPIAIRLMGTAIGQLDKKLDEAARIFALPSFVRLIDIEAALLAKPGLYAWLLVTASVMYELPISELLYVPGATPLGVAIVSADMMAEYGQAARLALLGLLSLGVLAAVLSVALNFVTRQQPETEAVP
ncbi:ABC transporter permease [Acidocella sp.]|jgi:iron(III) transport system permease protein|uniref:ABC transporter permease n=1 Tax=Acidocella sp. TaxID=50710 RepID=UPI002F4236C4